MGLNMNNYYYYYYCYLFSLFKVLLLFSLGTMTHCYGLVIGYKYYLILTFF